MSKFNPIKISRRRSGYIFLCPGCNQNHHIQTSEKSKPYWSFNGDLEKPTVSPSIRVQYYHNELGIDMLCHSFIKDGMIQFLGDCTHDLKNKTVEIPEWT